jgi:hypothetical protein
MRKRRMSHLVTLNDRSRRVPARMAIPLWFALLASPTSLSSQEISETDSTSSAVISVRMDCERPGRIFLEGVEVGACPGNVEVPAGEYQFEVVFAEGSWIETVVVRAGESLVLKPDVGAWSADEAKTNATEKREPEAVKDVVETPDPVPPGPREEVLAGEATRMTAAALDPIPAEATENATTETTDQKLRTAFSLRSELNTSDNLDFRALDNNTFIDIYDSDDRRTFVYTRVGASVGLDITESTSVDLSLSHTGLWGGDQLGGTDSGGGLFYLDRLHVDWTPVQTEGLRIATTVGRQPFSTGSGGVFDDKPDYFFDDVIDGLVIETDLAGGGRIQWLALDVYAANSRPDQIDFAQPSSSSSRPTVGFDGDTNTMRFGAVYDNTHLVDGLDLRVFGFYADIGAGGTGSDRVLQGSAGNFSDADFVWMGGGRAAYRLTADAFSVDVWGEFARSGGVDRKATHLGLYDVTTNGNAFGGGIQPRMESPVFGVHGQLGFFMAEGAQYTGGEGLLFNHGFVSFKGDHVGGLNMNRYAGWHPSTYLGTNGIYSAPQDTNRMSGTMSLHGGLGLEFSEALTLDFDFWYFADTSTSNLDPTLALTVADELPFGYTLADLEAQERFGKPLGVEIDARLGYQANEHLSLYSTFGLFEPSEFYQIEIDRSAGTARGSMDAQEFWAVSTGLDLRY